LKHHREHARESERDEIISAREQSIRRRNLTGASEGVAGGWRVLGGEAGMNRETLEEEREVEEGVEIDLTFPGGPRRRERGGREGENAAGVHAREERGHFIVYTQRHPLHASGPAGCFVRWLGSPGSASAPARHAGPVPAARMVISDLPFTALSGPAQSGRRLETKSRFQFHQ